MSIEQIPQIGLGTWELEGDTCADAVETALRLGYRHIDTAQAYGNEDRVGEGLARSDVDRDDVWVTTKVWNSQVERDRVIASADRSLERLGLDHVDLLLLHWPVEMDRLEDTLEQMQSLVDAGKVRHIGVSNFTADQVRRAAKVTDVFCNQVEYHAMLDQSAVREACADVGARVVAYSPLARGDLLRDPVVTNVAGARSTGPAQIALRWLLDQDVVVIPKASSEAHLAANLEALSMPPLEPEDTAALDQLPKDRRVIDPPFAPDWD